jgi:hypothetical protein
MSFPHSLDSDLDDANEKVVRWDRLTRMNEVVVSPNDGRPPQEHVFGSDFPRVVRHRVGNTSVVSSSKSRLDDICTLFDLRFCAKFE